MTGQEFNAILLSLLAVIAVVAGILFWRMFTRMEKKIDDWFAIHLQCRERQQEELKEFVKVKNFEDWKEGRASLWKRLNRHAHDPKTSKVIITED